ncbi:outer membrane beta-barrel protein [Rhodopseudomonas sp. HC1]|uniref:outer membrane beta-barrel protein n=1 Tax=Rhodopseudomonas infernalis TaxID=2897386 RepID=UPI001EE8C492|nr:outer membrane beta-barrel protein [Rhodopseudomonas infernalis]MCG6207231.1 outer membrane beta-barrel protein [Rhodopseudomonas infernalis]
MRRFAAVSAVLFLATGTATAADLPGFPQSPAPPVSWNWTGLYWGAHLGGSFGSSSFSDPAGQGLYGGSVRSPAAMAGIQLGYNYQPNRNWLVGVEADLSALNAKGTNSCLVSSGLFISANCRVRQDALATLTGRAGFVTGPGGRTLLYAKAGGAFLSERLDITAGYPIGNSTDIKDGRWGWTAGAGIEQALAPAWSVKFEYDYADFGSREMATPASYRLVPGVGYFATPQGVSKVTQDLHAVKVGLNLKFGGDVDARFDDYHLRGTQSADDVIERGAVEVGGRVWYSSGRFQKDLGATFDQGNQNILISRLTYQSTAASGELFGRVDGPSDTFLKGFAGGGKLLSGHMNDEDWIADEGIPYSNTLSDPVKGSIAYATLDVGYNLLRGSDYKFGGFVGYNYYRENKSAYGCVQTAGGPASAICGSPISNAILAMTENDTWHSLRVGFNGELGLGRGVKLSADAAYLPYVKMFGTDNHVLRTDVKDIVSPEQGTGQGVQLEAILSYQVNSAFAVGAGARYWAMWATTDAYTNIFGTQCPCQTLPTRTERYGTFLQAAYKFDSLK